MSKIHATSLSVPNYCAYVHIVVVLIFIENMFFDGNAHGWLSSYVARTRRGMQQDWIHQELLNRKSEYQEQVDLRISIGTWNVNGRLSEESFDDWLLSSTCAHQYEAIYF